MSDMIGDFGLSFSVHAMVRYVERHVDPQTIQALREQRLDDHQILNAVKIAYAPELDLFVTRATHAYNSRCSMTRDAMFGLSYILNVGHVPLRICGDVCVSVMPAHWHDDRINRKYQTPRTWRRRRLEVLSLEAA